MTKKILFIAGLVLFSLGLKAQFTINIVSKNIPTPTVSELVKNKDMVQVFVTNTGTTPRSIKVIGNLKKDGVIVSQTTVNTVGVVAVDIAPGQTVIKYIYDLIDFRSFDVGNFGRTALQTGLIPAGNYTGCATVVDATTGATLSSEFCTSFEMTDYYPAELTQPSDKSILTAPVVNFYWTGINPTYTASAITYTLRIWELNPGENPIAIVKYESNLVARYENISIQSYPINMLQLNLQEDKEYVWAIQAYNASGEKIGKESVPKTFKYGKNYSDKLKSLLSLMDLHEQLVREYMAFKKTHECEGKPFSEAKKVHLPKVNSIQQQIDQLYTLNQTDLANFNTNISSLNSLKQGALLYASGVSYNLQTYAFGQKIKDAINTIKAGAYSYALVDINESCEDLTNTKKPKQTKQEKKKEQERNYIEELAAASDNAALQVDNSINEINNNKSNLKKEVKRIQPYATEVYTKYETVVKKVSKTTLAKDSVQLAFKELKNAFLLVDQIRKDESLLNTKSKELSLALRNAARYLRGLAPLTQPTEETKESPIAKCYFTDLIVAVPQQVYQDGWLNKTSVSWKIDGKVDKIKFKRFNTYSNGDYNEFDDKEERELAGDVTSANFEFYGGQQNLILEAYIGGQLVSKGVFPIFTAAPKEPIIGKCEVPSSTTTNTTTKKVGDQTKEKEEEVKETKHEIAKVVEKKGMPKVGDPDCILSYARAGAILYGDEINNDGYDYIIDWGGVDYNYGSYNSKEYRIEVEYTIGGKVVGADASWAWRNSEGQSRPAFLTHNDNYTENVTGKLTVYKNGKVVTTVNFDSFPKDKFAAGNCDDSMDKCAGVKCENGGKCEDGTCLCPEGFTGKSCEVTVKKTTHEIAKEVKEEGMPKVGDPDCILSYARAGAIYYDKGTPSDGWDYIIDWGGIDYPYGEYNIQVEYNIGGQVTGSNTSWVWQNEEGQGRPAFISASDKYLADVTAKLIVSKGGKVVTTVNFNSLPKGKFAAGDCDNSMDKCADVKCQNGGKCVDGTCECPEGFAGSNCQVNTKEKSAIGKKANFQKDGFADKKVANTEKNLPAPVNGCLFNDFSMKRGEIVNHGYYDEIGRDFVTQTFPIKVTILDSADAVWYNGEDGRWVVGKNISPGQYVEVGPFWIDTTYKEDFQFSLEIERKGKVVSKLKTGTFNVNSKVVPGECEGEAKKAKEIASKEKEDCLFESITTRSNRASSNQPRQNHRLMIQLSKDSKINESDLTYKVDWHIADNPEAKASKELQGSSDLFQLAADANYMVTVLAYKDSELVGKAVTEKAVSGGSDITFKCIPVKMASKSGSETSTTQEKTKNTISKVPDAVKKEVPATKGKELHDCIFVDPTGWAVTTYVYAGEVDETYEGQIWVYIMDWSKLKIEGDILSYDTKLEFTDNGKVIQPDNYTVGFADFGNSYYRPVYVLKEGDWHGNVSGKIVVSKNGEELGGFTISKFVQSNSLAECIKGSGSTAVNPTTKKEEICAFKDIAIAGFGSDIAWNQDEEFDEVEVSLTDGSKAAFTKKLGKTGQGNQNVRIEKSDKFESTQYVKIVGFKGGKEVAKITTSVIGSAVNSSGSLPGRFPFDQSKANCTSNGTDAPIETAKKERTFEKGDSCFFSNVKSSRAAKTAATSVHTFTWEEQGKVDEIIMNFYNSNGDDFEFHQAVKVGTKSFSWEIYDEGEYIFHLVAKKGGKIFSTAISKASKGKLESITLSPNVECPVDPCKDVKCQNGGKCKDGNCECPDGYTGKNCEEADFTCVVFDGKLISKNLGLLMRWPTDVDYNCHEQSFSWTNNLSFDELKVSWEVKDPAWSKTNGNKTIPKSSKSFAIKLHKDQSYKVTVVALKGGKEIAKFRSDYTKGDAGSVTLKCVTDSENETAKNKVEDKCFFVNARSTTRVWQNTGNKHYTHDFTWKVNGEADEIKLKWISESDANGTGERVLTNTTTSESIALNTGEKYVVSLTAFKGGKPIAKVIATNADGGAEPIVLTCTDDLEGKVELAAVKKANPCLDVKCENGGECKDGKCECPEGFTGKNCENDCVFYNVYGTISDAYGASKPAYLAGWKINSNDVEYVAGYLLEEGKVVKEFRVDKGTKSPKSRWDYTIEFDAKRDKKGVFELVAYSKGKVLSRIVTPELIVTRSPSELTVQCFKDAPSHSQDASTAMKKEEKPCYFGNVTSSGVQWQHDERYRDHTFVWKSDLDADQFKLLWYVAGKSGDKQEKVVPKGFNKKEITLSNSEKYNISLTAYKGGKPVARAIATNADGNSSSISLTCTDDLTEEVAAKKSNETVTVSADGLPSFVEGANCFYSNIKSTSSQYKKDTKMHTFTWEEEGKVDAQKVIWYHKENVKSKGEKAISLGAKSVTVELADNTEYYVHFIAAKGGEVYSTALSQPMKGASESITLSPAVKCKEKVIPRTFEKGENCFFSNVKSARAPKTASTCVHTFTWEEQGMVDEVIMNFYNSNHDKFEFHQNVKPGTKTFSWEIYDEGEYFFHLVAKKGGKVYASALSNASKGSIASIELIPDVKCPEKNEEKECFFTNVRSTTRVWQNTGNKHYTHDFTWKVNGEADEIKLKWISESDANGTGERVLAKNATSESIALNTGEKYVVSLTAFKGGKPIAKAIATNADGGAEPIVLTCTDDLEEKAAATTKEATTTKKEEVEEEKCFFGVVQSDGIAWKDNKNNVDHAFRWTTDGSAEEVKFSWYDVNDEAGKQEKVFKDKGLIRHQMTLNADKKYVIVLTAFKGGKVIAKAFANDASGEEGHIQLKCTNDLEGPVVPKKAETAKKEEEKCFFGVVQSDGIAWKGNKNIVDHAFRWTTDGSADEVKFSWYDVNNEAGKQEKVFKDKGLIRSQMTLNADKKYVIVLTAFKGGKVIAKAFANGVSGEEGHIKLNCTNDLEGKIEPVKSESTEKKEEKATCALENVKSDGKVWSGNSKNYDHSFTWKYVGDADQFKLVAYPVSNSGSKIEKTEGKDVRRTQITLTTGQKYFIALTALKNGKAIERASVIEVEASTSSIALSCTNDLEGKEDPKQAEVQAPAEKVKDCFFTDAKSSGLVTPSSDRYYYQTFSWTEHGSVDKVQITWHEASDPTSKGTKDIKSGEKSTKIELAAETKYVINLVATNGGKEVAVATSGEVKGGLSSIVLNCTADSKGSANTVTNTEQKTKEVENCVLTENVTVGKDLGNGLFEHNWMWYSTPEVNKWYLEWKDVDNPGDVQHVTFEAKKRRTSRVQDDHIIQLKKDKKYILKMIAYSDDTPIAKAESKPTLGSASNIFVPCVSGKNDTKDEAIKATSAAPTKEQMMAAYDEKFNSQCFFYNISSVGSKISDTKTSHLFTWKERGHADTVIIGYAPKSDTSKRTEVVVIYETTSARIELETNTEYVVYLHAYLNGQGFAATTSPFTSGGASNIYMGCDAKSSSSQNTKTGPLGTGCVITEASSTGANQGNGFSNHTVRWKGSSKVSYYQMIWYEEDNPGAAMSQNLQAPANHPADQFLSHMITLKNDKKYVVVLLATDGNKRITKMLSNATLGSSGSIILDCYSGDPGN